MFSQLGPLFKTMFRSAEAADARLEIRREEKESGRKREGDEETIPDNNDLWEDSTSVSVTALRTFLIDFLRNQNGHDTTPDLAQQQQDLPNIDMPAEEVQPPAPTSTIAMRAAKAYGAMAAQNTPPAPLQPPQPAGEENLADLLESDEVRQIHQLIAELDDITRKGIESLKIELEGRTFLEAVATAIHAAKESS